MARITGKRHKSEFSTFFAPYSLKPVFLHKQEISEKKPQANKKQTLSYVWTYIDDWKLEFHIIIIIRIQILNLSRNIQGQGQCIGRDVPTMLMVQVQRKESCCCNCLHTVMSNVPNGKLSQTPFILELLL